MPASRTPSIARLADDGPLRSRAAASIVTELRMSLGVCPDRGDPIARRILDRIVNTAQEARST